MGKSTYLGFTVGVSYKNVNMNSTETICDDEDGKIVKTKKDREILYDDEDGKVVETELYYFDEKKNVNTTETLCDDEDRKIVKTRKDGEILCDDEDEKVVKTAKDGKVVETIKDGKVVKTIKDGKVVKTELHYFDEKKNVNITETLCDDEDGNIVKTVQLFRTTTGVQGKVTIDPDNFKLEVN